MEETMKIPVAAKYRIIDGEPVCVHQEFAEITPDEFARFLIRQFGHDAIFGGGGDPE